MDLSNYKTKTLLILPFNGVWEVANGGRDTKKNGHRTINNTGPRNQLYAYDFIKDYQSEGKNLEDYYAFGQDVISPADGIIYQVIDGSKDMPIGESDDDVIAGNMIMIDHQNGEYSVLAHFKYSSIKVKVGDNVKQGDLLGQCGNTGNTSEPHIHYHLQDNSLMHKANGLPAQFKQISVNGKKLENVEVERGQIVSNTN
jgi:murein DD-endopeptidase MepM/ murein hydrolase activator NlpD